MSRSRKYLGALAVVLAAGWIYWPALHGGWIWDDRTEISQVAALHGPDALSQIWIAPATLDYYPVKTTLQWLQWRAWGDDTFGYHLTNVLLHVCSALLLWRLLRKLGVREAAFGALLFVVHPIAVESVAWVDELKNALSLPFLLLAMLAYVEFSDRSDKARRHYLLALFFFLLAMLSKSSVVMFPVVLLLFAWWRRGTIRMADLRSAAPFFAISLALGLVAVWFQRHHGFGGSVPIPFGGMLTRTARAGLVAAFYFSKCLFPVGLMPVYPRWEVDTASLASYLPWLAIAVGFAWLWTKRTTWGRHALFGLGWFFLNLAPVLGFIPISHMRFAWTMDHLTYLPLVGLVGLAAAGLGALEGRLGGSNAAPGRVALGAAVAVCVLLAVVSRSYAAKFGSPESFWTYAVERNPTAWLAQSNLGDVFLDRGDAQTAIGRFERALQLNPDYPEAEYNLGLACAKLGRLPEAIAHYAASLRLEPKNAGARNNLGNAYLRLGRFDEAAAQYEEALRLDPNVAGAHVGLGGLLAQAGRIGDAIEQFEAAARLAPDDADLHYNLGLALAQAGRLPEAAAQFERVLQLRPDDAGARENLLRTRQLERP
jgi:tetratricopeptide (TPR) repeat protein